MTENNETETKKQGFIFNMGKVTASYNGCFVNICARMEDTDKTHCLHKGCSLSYHNDNGQEYYVPFIYSDLSPAEAYMLAKDLIDCAKEAEQNIKTDWIITINGHPYWDCEHCMAIRDSEEEAKADANALSKDNPQFKWGYRKMTVTELYNYLGH